MADEICSRCEGALDTKGSPKWCKSCRAGYRRGYEATRKEMSEGRGFCAGITAMRDYLAKQFSQYGTAGNFSGAEISQIIAGCKGPELPG